MQMRIDALSHGANDFLSDWLLALNLSATAEISSYMGLVWR